MGYDRKPKLTPPTTTDLGRLMVFADYHGGHLPDVPQGVVTTFERLRGAGLVELTEGELPDAGGTVWMLYAARITERGTRTVEAMTEAAERLAKTVG